MNLFFAPDIQGDTYTLSEDESKHIIRVLRLNLGEPLHLTDGHGNLFTAIIVENNPKKCRLVVTNKVSEFGKRDYEISIAIAPTKNIDRFEWFLEKSTEIGIDHIYPIICHRSERKVIKHDRSMRVITAAMKQSLKAYHPVLHELQSFSQFLKLETPSDKFIAHCDPGDKLLLKPLVVPGNKSIILIGPEGDFTPDEIKNALKSGFQPVSLGPSRLRTETAGVAACHTFSLVNQ